MSNILILPLNSEEPDPSIYIPIRQTRKNKYYKVNSADPNAMDIQMVTTATDNDLESFENAFSNLSIGIGAVGGSKKSKSKKSRKYRKNKRRVKKSRKQ
jgi:hypothetical protein